RPWPTLFALADHGIVARDLVHTDRLGRGPLRAADRARLVSAFGGCLGAGGRDDFGTIRRRACRRGNEAGLSRHPRAARKASTGACARTRTGSITARCAIWLAQA